MKKYFTKYLPVEGEIKEHDLVFKDDERGVVVFIYPNDEAYEIELFDNHVSKGTATYPASRVKLAKLFLCSRDIQVGDKYFSPVSNIWDICDNPIMLEQIKEMEAKHNHGRFKVIGEISPDALSYVKEGDEFDEDNLGFYVSSTFIQEPWSKLNLESGFKLLKEGIWKVAIKGPCGHFH